MNIQLTDEITFADSSTLPVSVLLSADAIIMHIHNKDYALQWNDIHNVELLADVFADISVRSFKVVVDLLGKAYTLKDTL